MIEFHKKIKELRKTQNITQEQLAGYLNISPQAVSRWECGLTCPDIALLPQIAELFGITVDELLGVNEKEKNREIGRVIEEAERELNQGITEEPIKKLRIALMKYPNNDRLLCSLLYGLYAASEDADFCRVHDEEIFAIAARIEEYSKDEYCRNEARRLLFRHYCDTGRNKEARHVAAGMAKIEACFERNYYWALEGEERLAYLKERIADDLRYLTWDIWAYETHADIGEEEKHALELLREQIEMHIKEKFIV